MKNIFKLSFIVAAAIALLGTASCTMQEVDTDQLSGPIALAAMSPNPVVRGAELHIYGTNLDKVKEVRIPGVAPIKEFTKGAGQGRLGEIIVTVPLEGPEVGKVVIADASGNTSSSKFDLTYTEGMVFQGFTCKETVMPGDVITLEGEYIYLTQEVIFTSGSGETRVIGDAIFDKERHSAKVYVPASATDGIIKICDVDEAANPSAIPNIYPSIKEIKVGKPTVDVAEFTKPVKAGSELTFTGAYLNMISKVTFSGVEVDFTVNDAANELKANLPAKAADGDVVFTSYAGDTFVAGTLAGVLPSGLAISPDIASADPRYKAGYATLILGEDLDLVTGVSFGGVNADFQYVNVDGELPDTLVAYIPFTAPDGDVKVALANGSDVTVGAIEIVKPTITKVSKDEIVAREQFEITGKDLELITKLTVGGIECKIALDTIDVLDALDEEGDPIKIAVLDSTKMIVTTDPTVLSGDVVIEKENGWNSAISKMTVTYNEPITLEMPAEVKLGKAFKATGTNLFAIETVRIKGKKVVDWVSHSSTEISFNLPEGIGPGVYRLELVLNDGTELTWAIPFEVTAPYTETFVWEGSSPATGNYEPNMTLGGEDDWVNAGIKEGCVIRIYFTCSNPDDWGIQLWDGHWNALSELNLDGDLHNQFNQTNSPEAAAKGYIAFNAEGGILTKLSTHAWWGNALIAQGKNVTITGLSLLTFEAATERVVWEGEPGAKLFWGDGGALQLLAGEIGELPSGSKLNIYYTVDADNPQVKLCDINWTLLPGFGTLANEWGVVDLDKSADVYKLSLTDEDINAILNNEASWGGRGLVIAGQNATVTKVAIE